MSYTLVIVTIVLIGSLIGSGPWLLEKAGDAVEWIDYKIEERFSPEQYAARQNAMRTLHDQTPLEH